MFFCILVCGSNFPVFSLEKTKTFGVTSEMLRNLCTILTDGGERPIALIALHWERGSVARWMDGMKEALWWLETSGISTLRYWDHLTEESISDSLIASLLQYPHSSLTHSTIFDSQTYYSFEVVCLIGTKLAWLDHFEVLRRLWFNFSCKWIGTHSLKKNC